MNVWKVTVFACSWLWSVELGDWKAIVSYIMCCWYLFIHFLTFAQLSFRDLCWWSSETLQAIFICDLRVGPKIRCVRIRTQSGFPRSWPEVPISNLRMGSILGSIVLLLLFCGWRESVESRSDKIVYHHHMVVSYWGFSESRQACWDGFSLICQWQPSISRIRAHCH